MIHGRGTPDDPLVSTRARLMDLSLMLDYETTEERVVLIIEHSEREELYALAFTIDDFREIIERGAKLLDMP